MTAVRLKNVDVHIPIYDSHSRRLIRLPSCKFAKVGAWAISASGTVLRYDEAKRCAETLFFSYHGRSTIPNSG